MLSSRDPRFFSRLSSEAKHSHMRNMLHYYIPLSEEKETEIWEKQRKAVLPPASEVPEDERVEDAGLAEDAPIPLNPSRSKKKHPRMGP